MSFVRVAILKHGLTVWDQTLLPWSDVERRLQTTRALMQANGWAGLVAYSDQLHCGNVAYLTNFHSYEPRHPALAVVTADTIDLVPKVAARDLTYIRGYSWVDAIHECEADLATSLATVAELRGLTGASIGFDGARAAPIQVALGMRSVFASGTVSDATDLMRNVRRAKSAAERTLMTNGAAMAETVLSALRAFVQPRMSELDVAAFADYTARRHGCMDTDVLVLRPTAGRASCHRFPFVPVDARTLVDGLPVNVYLALQYHGYWIEIAESIAVGTAHAAHADGMALARAHLQEALDGTSASAPLPDGCALWIHGIGLDRDEPPLVSQLKEPDAPGDLLGVHVEVERAGAHFVCGRSVAVVERTRRVLA